MCFPNVCIRYMTLLNPLRSVYAQELSWIALCDTACVYGLNFIVQWKKKKT
jgi:hypothetical protein